MKVGISLAEGYHCPFVKSIEEESKERCQRDKVE